MKQVINDALREALGRQARVDEEPYHLEPHESTLRPGFDLAGFNRLADELDEDAILAKTRRTG